MGVVDFQGHLNENKHQLFLSASRFHADPFLKKDICEIYNIFNWFLKYISYIYICIFFTPLSADGRWEEAEFGSGAPQIDINLPNPLFLSRHRLCLHLTSWNSCLQQVQKEVKLIGFSRIQKSGLTPFLFRGLYKSSFVAAVLQFQRLVLGLFRLAGC